jgi:hypothetical protein
MYDAFSISGFLIARQKSGPKKLLSLPSSGIQFLIFQTWFPLIGLVSVKLTSHSPRVKM